MGDLVRSHCRELPTEDVEELNSFIEQGSGEEELDPDDTTPTSEIQNVLTAWSSAKRFMSRHPAIK
jgi:hypothetical protein